MRPEDLERAFQWQKVQGLQYVFSIEGLSDMERAAALGPPQASRILEALFEAEGSFAPPGVQAQFARGQTTDSRHGSDRRTLGRRWEATGGG